MENIKTITSVSGGRTSSYMTLHYPTDYNIFSLVRIEDKNCTPKDKNLIQYVEDKIQMPFIATAEDDLTLYALIQLEQDLGKEIIWVTSEYTFEQIIKNHQALPNRQMRFCTTDLKMTPIFWYCYLYLLQDENDFISMNIGYRADEPKRTATTDFDFVKSCNYYGQNRQNWETIEWREVETPLRKDYIEVFTVHKYFRSKPEYKFPIFSNCVFCFHSTEEQLYKKFTIQPDKMQWAKGQEVLTKRTFNFQKSLFQIENGNYNRHQMPLFDCSCTD